MSMTVFVRKAMHYYRRKGLLQTLRHIPVKLRWTLFRKPVILYVCDLTALDGPPAELPERISVLKIEQLHQLGDNQRRTLAEDMDESVFSDQCADRFRRGSVLWVITHDDQPAGLFWTMAGGSLRPHYFCLTRNDAHLYDGRILERFRGRGLFVLLTNYILRQLNNDRLQRAFVETNTANIAARRAFDRCPVRPVATARKFHMFGRNITIWKCQEPRS